MRTVFLPRCFSSGAEGCGQILRRSDAFGIHNEIDDAIDLRIGIRAREKLAKLGDNVLIGSELLLAAAGSFDCLLMDFAVLEPDLDPNLVSVTGAKRRDCGILR